MIVCNLSSGSKGNCTYVQTKNHKILIDIGNSCLYVKCYKKESFWDYVFSSKDQQFLE